MAKPQNEIQPNKSGKPSEEKESKVGGFDSSAFDDAEKTEDENQDKEGAKAPPTPEPKSEVKAEPTYEASRFKNKAGIDESVPGKYRKFQK